MQPRLSDRVVGIGEATVDQMGVAPRSAEVEIELHRFSVQAGGAVGTALATVCAFGGQARYVGRLSDDEFGQIILRGLKEFGVDTSQVLIEPGKISPASFILVDERTGRRIVRYTRGSITPLEPGELPRELLDDAALLLVDGRVPAAQIAAAERAKALGVPVLLDARHLGPGMGELLDLSDAVIGSERFAAEVAHSSDVKRSLREIVKLGPRVAVLTLGEEGAIGLESDAIVRAAAVPVEMYDSTGSSDVFRGAFAYGMLNGWSLDRSLPFANAAAGLNCRHLGGLGGIPSLAEVMRTAGL
ncbi:MAG TPA: PfkB family carbohydrate kinase [Polyangia bacterium]|jgi:sulfofructose kinase|nr:PfkB family carbohydrate kinase [Polyangia bacterium]